jgi:L-alanine-DL-glutamate epimerase-like enolase superfamily enzyme
MKFELRELTMPLCHAFTIARGSSSTAQSIVGRFEHQGVVGLGEVSPSRRYHESLESVQAWFSKHPPSASSPFAFDDLLAGVPPAARCLLDVALHDWIGKSLDVPLWQYWNLDSAQTPITSFTIGLDTTQKMLEKLEEIREHPVIKVKLALGRDLEILEALRSRYTGILRIDANEAWTAEEAVRLLTEMQHLDIELCEQPIPAGTPEQLRWIRERVSIPIVADEDAKNAEDILKLRGCVDGVNLKLVKTGGLRGAIDAIRTARALGMKIMLGCMVESSILTTAAAHLTPLVDWADLDGPFLVAEDPYSGVIYNNGKLVLPTAPGLGVEERGAHVAN